MKKIIVCLVSVIVAMVMVFGFAGCTGASVDPTAYSYVTIDINPSVELITLGDEVIEVKAGNYDATVLLDGEDFSSMTLEDATAKIVALAEQMGYLTDTNNQVKISVLSDDATTQELLKSAAKSGAQKGSKKAEPTVETRLQDKLTLDKLKEDDKFATMTEEKVRLIESIMEYDSTMTYEIGNDMTVKELSARLKSVASDNKEIFTAELRNEYSTRYTEAKQDIERQIATIYGDEYLEKWEEYTALENVYNSIVNAIETGGVAQEDVDAIVEILKITDTSLIQKGGVIKREYILNYIDKHITKKATQADSQAIDEVVAILDKYDIAKHILTQDELQMLVDALGEEVDFATLAQVESQVKGLKSELDTLKNQADLTEEQVEKIETLEASFATIKDSVLEDMADTIEAVRAQVTAEKQVRSSQAD